MAKTLTHDELRALRFEASFTDGWHDYILRANHGLIGAGTRVLAKRRNANTIMLRITTESAHPYKWPPHLSVHGYFYLEELENKADVRKALRKAGIKIKPLRPL